MHIQFVCTLHLVMLKLNCNRFIWLFRRTLRSSISLFIKYNGRGQYLSKV